MTSLSTLENPSGLNQSQTDPPSISLCSFWLGATLSMCRSEAGRWWLPGSWDIRVSGRLSDRPLSVAQKLIHWVIFSSYDRQHLRRPQMEGGSQKNGGAERPRPGLDCTGCSDKRTGKGRVRQGNKGGREGLLLPQEDLTHPPDHLPHLQSTRV